MTEKNGRYSINAGLFPIFFGTQELKGQRVICVWCRCYMQVVSLEGNTVATVSPVAYMVWVCQLLMHSQRYALTLCNSLCPSCFLDDSITSILLVSKLIIDLIFCSFGYNKNWCETDAGGDCLAQWT
jgi:hypothetical protein